MNASLVVSRLENVGISSDKRTGRAGAGEPGSEGRCCGRCCDRSGNVSQSQSKILSQKYIQVLSPGSG